MKILNKTANIRTANLKILRLFEQNSQY